MTCERGTVNKSILYLAKRWGWSREKTRNFLHYLELDGMLRVNATTHRTTLTLVNYGKYQDTPTTNRTAKRQQTDSKPTTNRTRREEGKEGKEGKEDICVYDSANADTHTPAKGVKTQYGENGKVLLTADEFEKLNAEYGAEPTRVAIAFLDEHIAQTGYKSKSHYYALRRWVFSAVRERDLKQKEIEQREARLKQYGKKEFDINNWTPEEG